MGREAGIPLYYRKNQDHVRHKIGMILLKEYMLPLITISGSKTLEQGRMFGPNICLVVGCTNTAMNKKQPVEILNVVFAVDVMKCFIQSYSR